jgi:hypothetical protein
VAAPIVVVDKFVESLGLRPIAEEWLRTEPPAARRIVLDILERDLAYGMPAVPPPLALELTDALFAPFGLGSLYFANCAPRVRANGWSWCPLSDATFDVGVVCLSDERIGVLCVQDED